MTSATVGPAIEQFRERFIRITQEVGRRIVFKVTGTLRSEEDVSTY